MNNLQRHSNKLWFAGSAQNWELAQFYVHELEESMEKVEQANVFEDGIALSPLMRNLGLKSLENLEEAIKNKESKAFDEAYDLMVANCNSCHNAAKHPFIVIQKPKNPAFDNQIYTPSAI
jgi:muramidase (phage lysozyme)